MTRSSHKVEIVPIILEPHPNADNLSIVKVFGYTVCVRTEDWKDKSIGAYIPPDSIVPDTPEFGFLNGHRRIKVRKMRGIISQGLLVPAPDGSNLGDDVAERIGIKRYEPPEDLTTGGEVEKPPDILSPIYDVEDFNRYGHLFVEGERVIVTEKIHGSNARYVWHNGRMYVGSRKEWKKENPDNAYWKALYGCPELMEFCQSHENYIVYGEVYGWVQDLRYGHTPGRVSVAVFDILHDNIWLDSYLEFPPIPPLPFVPLITVMPFEREKVLELAEGLSLINGANHIREGVVIRSIPERISYEIGRMQLKLVSNQYLEK